MRIPCCCLGGLAILCLWVGVGTPRAAQAQIYVFEDEEGVIHFSDTRVHDGFRRHVPKSHASRTRSTLQPVPLPAPQARFDHLIARASRTHRVSPGLVKAVIHVESHFDPRAVSHKGARGLMQLMPATAGELGVTNPFDPWQNIEGGTRYLQEMVSQFDGDLQLGLAAYHAGPGNVRRHRGIPPFRSTRQYVARVLKLYRRYYADFR